MCAKIIAIDKFNYCNCSFLSIVCNQWIIAFDGFLALYKEDQDDPVEGEENEDERRLPPLEQGMATRLMNVDPEQHFTQPPPRYSEASLVKALEELGIGRPSSYASIMQVLQDRNYVTLDKRRFMPEDRGRLVTSFLSSYFEKYVDYDFTACSRMNWTPFHRAPFSGNTRCAISGKISKPPSTRPRT